MNAVVNNLSPEAIAKVIEAARLLPHGADTKNSRVADKFVIRGYKELFAEMDRLAVLQLRSKNSEVNMAIIDSINGRVTSSTILGSLCAVLGEELSSVVLAAVPEFFLADCKYDDSFVIRFPDEVRDAMTEAANNEESVTMIAWIRLALVYWINNQRQQQALLAAIAALRATGE